MKWQEKLKGLIDISLTIIIAIGVIFIYDEYKRTSEKVYVVDVQKIYQQKQSAFKVSEATEDEAIEHYNSLEKLILFSNAYIDAVSKNKDALVYPKTHILTTKSAKIVDLTDDLIVKLKIEKLLP